MWMQKKQQTEWVSVIKQTSKHSYVLSYSLLSVVCKLTVSICVTGRVPMRRLVYRVQPLPQSMLPLVWDFGQLDTKVEEMYIKQMVLRYVRTMPMS